MTLGIKDAFATVLTGLAVLVFAATHQAWDVWLVGSSHRWAAVAILLLGMATCSLGSAELNKGRGMSTTPMLLAAVGVASLVFAVWAIATGSLTALWLLVAATVCLWAGSTLRHAWQPRHGPLPV